MKSKSFPLISAFPGSRLGISHQVRLYKKNTLNPRGRNALLFLNWLFSSSKSVLRNARSYPGLQWEGSSVHHRQGWKKGQRGESSPSFALSPRTSFSFFLYFLHNLFWECLYGILINSGKYCCVHDIVICLIQRTAWLSTVLVLSSGDWYKMAMLFLEFWGFFLFWHILIIKVTFKRKVGYRWNMHWILFCRWIYNHHGGDRICLQLSLEFSFHLLLLHYLHCLFFRMDFEYFCFYSFETVDIKLGPFITVMTI